MGSETGAVPRRWDIQSGRLHVGVTNNILPVIWVAVGGRKSLTATVASALMLAWLSQRLAIQGEYAFVVMGALLVTVMMLLPDGIVTAFVKKSMPRRLEEKEC